MSIEAVTFGILHLVTELSGTEHLGTPSSFQLENGKSTLLPKNKLSLAC